MTTDTDKLVEMARAVCRTVAELPDRNSPTDWPEAMLVTHDELNSIVIEKSRELISSLCGDVEPVAWRFRWNPQGDWHITSHEPRGGDGTNKEPLYPASTVAALKAERDALLNVLEEVEQWWLMQTDRSSGAPACMFLVRAATASKRKAP